MSQDENALTGIRILVTRAVGQAEKLTGKLQVHGAIVEELPLIEIKEPIDFGPLDLCLKKLHTYDWIIFASANAVRHTLARAEALQIPLEGLLLQYGVRVAVVGAATARAAGAFKLKVDFAPRQFVSDFLVDEFPDYPKLEGKNIFWPRTNIGRDTILEGLSAAGATVDCAVAYSTVTPQFSKEQAKKLVGQLRENHFDAITLTSSFAAANLLTLLQMGLADQGASDHREIDSLLSQVKLAAIGPVTAATAKKYLGKIDIEAADHTMAGLTEALLASLKFKQKPT